MTVQCDSELVQRVGSTTAVCSQHLPSFMLQVGVMWSSFIKCPGGRVHWAFVGCKGEFDMDPGLGNSALPFVGKTAFP